MRVLLVKSQVTVVLAFVALVALVSAIFYEPAALPPNIARYALPQFNAARDAVVGHTYALDVLVVDSRQQPIGAAPMVVARGQSVSIVGWALDPRTMSPGMRLESLLDRRRLAAVFSYKIPRPDVAHALADPNAATSGFSARFPLRDVRAGRHRLEFIIVGKDGHATALPTVITLEVK